MALSRKSLRAMGIEDEKIEQIIELHTETVTALKDEIEKYKSDAEKLPSVEKELADVKQAVDGKADIEQQLAELKTEYERYKNDVNAKETKTAKENAVKAYFESKNIKGNNLKLAMKAAKDEISAAELADGNIKDFSAFDKLIETDFSGLVSTEQTVGAQVAQPPQNTGGVVKTQSRAAQLAAQYHANLYGDGKKGE